MWDELDEPLGFTSGPASPLAAQDRRPMRKAATVAVILAIAVCLVMLPRPDFSVKGEPFAVAKVEILPPPPKPLAPDATASVVQTAPTAASAGQVEMTSGVKITRGSGGGPPKPLIIDVAQVLSARLPPAPDSRLLEKSKYGLSPRTAVDGASSAEAAH